MNIEVPPGAIHEISAGMGELRAYVHEHRHGINNLSSKMDGLSIDVAKQIAALEAKMSVRIEQTHNMLSAEISRLEVAVRTLEAEKQRRDGATSIVAIVFKSPVLAWIAAVAAAAWAATGGKVHL